MNKAERRRRRREILLEDPMAEAGRKILALQTGRMKRRESGSRTGEDIESVHQMRVAIRRMRSLLKLIGKHYRPRTVTKYSRGLRRIARALGRVRDLDVLILDLENYRESLPESDAIALDDLIGSLDSRRRAHRERLNVLFDSKSYIGFVRQLDRFCKKRGSGAAPLPEAKAPHQIRHVLPLMLHDCLARVRAYDTVLPASDDTVLHALRVEYKQLRYAIEFFQPLLGTSADHFLRDVKAMQEILGRINDIAVFSEYLRGIATVTLDQDAVIASYLNDRDNELIALREQFAAQWRSFNSRANLRKFSDALLILR